MDKSASAKKELIVKIELFVILPGLGVDRKCRHGSLRAARRAIPENICSSRAFLRLTRSRHRCTSRILFEEDWVPNREGIARAFEQLYKERPAILAP